MVRFLSAVEVGWEKATRVEARDFCRWLAAAPKPSRPHWRRPDGPPPQLTPAAPNALTGKRPPGPHYAPATVAHAESVLRAFYDFHLEAGTGPMVNPFPLVRGARRGRVDAHPNPLEPFTKTRRGRYRPKLAEPALRMIPDEVFGQLFAKLCSHRDRALLAFYVSTGVRASELLGATVGDADPGQQLVTVVRKGTRALQQVPASPDAFVWRLSSARPRVDRRARPGRRVLLGGRASGPLRAPRPRASRRARRQALWPATGAPRTAMVNRLRSAPFALQNRLSQQGRRLALLAVVSWLQARPGQTWQQRWESSGAEAVTDWRSLLDAPNGRSGSSAGRPLGHLAPGLLVMISRT